MGPGKEGSGQGEDGGTGVGSSRVFVQRKDGGWWGALLRGGTLSLITRENNMQ